MFRPMRREKQQLSPEACQALLIKQRRGVLAMVGDGGYPYALPMNFWYDPEENALYFHGAREGHKLDAISRESRVCFTVMDEGRPSEADWSFYVNSVVVFGRAEPVADRELAREKAWQLGRKYYPTEEELSALMERSFPRIQLIRMEIEHMSGKQVHEK